MIQHNDILYRVFMEQSPNLEANSRLAGHEIPRLLLLCLQESTAAFCT